MPHKFSGGNYTSIRLDEELNFSEFITGINNCILRKDHEALEDFLELSKSVNKYSIHKWQEPLKGDDTPLNVAAANYDHVSLRLLLDYGADVNTKGKHGKTPLHTLFFDEVMGHMNEKDLIICTQLLANTEGVNVNLVDDKHEGKVEQLPPLYYAVHNRFEECARILIQHGALINERMTSHTPHNLATKLALTMPNVMTEVFDKAVRHVEPGNGQGKNGSQENGQRLELDFGVVLQYPQGINSESSMPKNGLMSTLLARDQKETSFIYSLLEGSDSVREQLLLHPLVMAFTHKKTTTVMSKLLWVYLIIFIFPLLYMGFIYYLYFHICPFDKFEKVNATDNVENHSFENRIIFCSPNNDTGCDPTERDASCFTCSCRIPWEVSLMSSLLVILLVIWFSTEILMIWRNDWRYMKSWRNWVIRVCITVMTLTIWPGLHFEGVHNLEFQYPIAALGIFFAWIMFLIQIGTHPDFAVYVEMLARILLSVIRVYLLFLPLLIAFYFGFSLMYNQGRWIFNFILMSTTVEIDTYAELVEQTKDSAFFFKAMGYTFCIAFIIIIVVVFMNFMLGIAISDIQMLRNKAAISSIARRIQNHFIVDMLYPGGKIFRSKQSDDASHPFRYRFYAGINNGVFPDDLTIQLVELAKSTAANQNQISKAESNESGPRNELVPQLLRQIREMEQVLLQLNQRVSQ